jgi:hypothetical protein
MKFLTPYCVSIFMYGVSLPIFVWSVIQTVRYQSAFDQYNYYFHRYEKNGHDQQDFDNFQKYADGCESYYLYIILDIITSLVLIIPILTWIRILLIERTQRRLETQFYPMASSQLIS